MASTITQTKFPYEPYPQQVELINSMRDCIEQSAVGCFESPTGTGKSMCALYACASWLLTEEERIIREYQGTIMTSSIPSSGVADDDDWLNEFIETKSAGKNVKSNQNMISKYDLMKMRIANAKHNINDKPMNSRSAPLWKLKHKKSDVLTQTSTTTTTTTTTSQLQDDQYALNPYNSDEDHNHTSNLLLSDDSSLDGNDKLDHEDAKEHQKLFPKIFYCSRTHSQLAQFIGEVKKSNFKELRCVTLGSRHNLCIHERLQGLKDSIVTEECMDMQKHGKKPLVTNPSAKSSLISTISVQPTKKRRIASVADEIGACPYHNRTKELKLSDLILNEVNDIEDIVDLGRAYQTCPYYSTRTSVANAQIVCLPYNMLISADMRENLDIDLRNCVVLIDEAHNLIETINQSYSSEISETDIERSMEAIEKYIDRFRYQLNGKNIYYTNLMKSVLVECKKILRTIGISSASKIRHTASPDINDSNANTTTVILDCNDFLFQCGFDNINFRKLVKHINSTNVVHKIAGYMNSYLFSQQNQQQSDMLRKPKANQPKNCESKANEPQVLSSTKSDVCSPSSAHMPQYHSLHQNTRVINYENMYATSLRQVVSFILCLTHANRDGKIVFKSTPVNATSNKSDTNTIGCTTQRYIQFAMLNPSIPFKEIIDKARSVMLLGGTMQPFDYLTSQLFPTISPQRLRTFACDHIVPSSHVIAVTLNTGPTGNNLELTHSNRLRGETVNEVFSSLLHLSQLIPCGVVVFFTSYAYMNQLTELWNSSGQLNRLKEHKQIFIEPRRANQSEAVWNQYKQSIEGSNEVKKFHQQVTLSSSESVFSDSIYSRSNMPKHFDSINSGAMIFCVIGGKLSEGINFSDNLARGVIVIGLPYPDKRDSILRMKLDYADSVRPNASNELYEAMCMKAVNQSIGRAIRHKDDYAAIIFLDTRYNRAKTIQQLPKWIVRSLVKCESFTSIEAELNEFFYKNRLSS